MRHLVLHFIDVVLCYDDGDDDDVEYYFFALRCIGLKGTKVKLKIVSGMTRGPNCCAW
jgi:hypothetical protein